MGRSGIGPRACGRFTVGLALVCLSAACTSPPKQPLPDSSGAGPFRVDAPAFDAERAWADARRIASYGTPRPGTRAARRVRAYLRKELGRAGVEVDEWVLPGPRTALLHVIGTLPGQSSDVFWIVTALESGLPAGDEADVISAASGAAAVLEVARALVDAPRPYTIRLAFIEGDAPRRRVDRATAHAERNSENASALDSRFAGSRAFVDELARRGDLDRIRMAVWLEAPGRDDLAVARDLRSHRAYREVFWQSAQALGETRVFANGAEYERAETGHLVLAHSGMRRVVAIAPGNLPAQPTENDDGRPQRVRRAQQNLAAVGRVTLRSIEQVGLRLQRIDGFARSPLAELPSEPDGSATAESEGPAGVTRKPSRNGDAGAEAAGPPPPADREAADTR